MVLKLGRQYLLTDVRSTFCLQNAFSILLLFLMCHCLFKVLINQLMSVSLGHCHCYYRLAALGLVSNLCFATLKMPDPTSQCTHINGMLLVHTFQAPVNFYGAKLWQ